MLPVRFRIYVLNFAWYTKMLYILIQKSSDDEEMDFNMKSKESSKEDDIQAICEMRGAGRNAPLALQLKAIDEEYHYLLDQGQSDRADYVQKLYAWKSKQATQVSNTSGTVWVWYNVFSDSLIIHEEKN